MAKMHSHRRGKSHSTRPQKSSATWVKQSEDEIVSLIVEMAKEGQGPSQIGTRLRDEHGIPLVKPIIGKSILKVLRDNNLAGELPEELDNLIKKALALQKHLSGHPGDRINIRSLELVEAKIHRLQKYYKRLSRIPKKWKYSAVIAKLE